METIKEEKKAEYSVALPQNYEVIVRVGNNPYEEEFEVKSTLSGIETRIRTKFGDDVEVIGIRLIREPKLKIGFTDGMKDLEKQLEDGIKELETEIEKKKMEEKSQSDERVNGAINTLREVPEK